jgi:hypothetical protein
MRSLGLGLEDRRKEKDRDERDKRDCTLAAAGLAETGEHGVDMCAGTRMRTEPITRRLRTDVAHALELSSDIRTQSKNWHAERREEKWGLQFPGFDDATGRQGPGFSDACNRDSMYLESNYLSSVTRGGRRGVINVKSIQ